MSLADFLSDAGCTVVTAATGQRALKEQRARPFDVCIVDVRLPGMDGLEILAALNEISADSRFIIHTGSPQFSLSSTLLRLGVREDHVIRKPVADMKVFVSLVEKLLSKPALTTTSRDSERRGL